jgi:NAD-dependent DNA ligase
MKLISTAALGAALLTLTACGGGADDRAAENVEAAGENMAENLHDMADNTQNEQVADRLEDQADRVEERADDKADEIDRTDNAAAETPAINGM